MKISFTAILLCIFPHIWIYIPWSKSTLAHVNNKTVLFYTTVLSILLNKYISEYIKYIKSGRKFQLSISNDIWPHVFISEVRSYIFMFLVAYLGYIFFSYVSIVHLLWRREGVGIYCKLIHDWIELTRARIFFSWPIQNRNTEPNSKYYLENYF